MTRRLSPLILLAAVLVCGGLARNASAAQFLYEAVLTVPANTDTLPNDAHVIFTNTGGSIKNAFAKSPWVRTISGASNAVDLTFSAKLAAGTQIVFHFYTDNNVLPGLGGGTWTNDGNDIRHILGGEITVTAKPDLAVPGVNTVGLIVLSLLTLGSGIYILGRRRTATA